MEGKAAARIHGAFGDLARLFAKALLSGIGVALALSLATLALSATAQAATLNDPKAVAVAASDPNGNEPWSVALAPPHDDNAAGASALWASDDPATVHFLLGLFALLSAGMVAVIGRHAQTPA